MANFQFRGCRAKFLLLKLIFEELGGIDSSQNFLKIFKFIKTHLTKVRKKLAVALKN